MADTPESVPTMAVDNLAIEAAVLHDVVAAMQKLSPSARQRLLSTLSTFFGIEAPSPAPRATHTTPHSGQARVDHAPFTEDRTLSPKEFLFEKRPVTDVDRAASLAYYLTHFRNTPHFKTLDISKLNTEAAQIKFSNATAAVNNSIRAGLLASVGRGQVQLSALGERYVQALPDRDAARAMIKSARPKRKSKKSSANSSDNA